MGIQPKLRLFLLLVRDNLWGITLIVAVLIFMIAGFIVVPNYVDSDTDNSTPQYGIATVLGIFQSPPSRGTPDPALIVSLRIGPHIVQAGTRKYLHSGQQVNVEYVVGKSGHIYISNIETFTE